MRRWIVEFAGSFARFIRRLRPAKVVVLGYLSYMLLGWMLLSLPFVQEGDGVSSLDALFTATSAVSTTGLSTIDVAASFNFGGELAVLLLIQLGGIGYMTFGSFIMLSGRGRLTGEQEKVGRTVFSLPEGFRFDVFVRRVVAFTLIVELLGAAALYPIFSSHGDPNPLWSSIFHSISAFCTAGFSLYSDGFEPFSDHFGLTFVIATLSYLGAIGFIVLADLWMVFSRRRSKMTLTSRIIIWTTLWISVGGTLFLFFGDSTLESLPPEHRFLAAFFQAMTAMTTVGFNTVPISGLSAASLFLLTGLMIVGASPSGTGGGLKTTTFSAIVGVMQSALRGEHKVVFWKCEVPLARVWMAVASLGAYLVLFFAGTYLLQALEDQEFEAVLFEAISALGTVGLSLGITSDLSPLGKIVIMFLMFCGRLGPLTFGVALFATAPPDETPHEEDLAI